MDNYSLLSQEILDRISRHCPESLSLYLNCINRADEFGNILFTKSMVEVDMSNNWRSFVTNIKKLALENLLEWHPFDDGISVKLADIPHDE